MPENYVQLQDVNGTAVDENEVNVDQDAPTSASYDATSPPHERVSSYSATDYEVQQTMTDEQQPPPPPPEQDLVEIPDGMFYEICNCKSSFKKNLFITFC